MIDESTLATHSKSALACAFPCSTTRIASNVPSAAQRSKRFHSVCHGPKSAGTSRHGEPVRNRHTIPSRTIRWSVKRPPRLPTVEGNIGSITAQDSPEIASARTMATTLHPPGRYIRETRPRRGQRPAPVPRGQRPNSTRFLSADGRRGRLHPGLVGDRHRREYHGQSGGDGQRSWAIRPADPPASSCALSVERPQERVDLGLRGVSDGT
jgi:hypothetical protein